ncbi:nucleotidyltransferase domain-containing protein [bacterium]|nr:nucleotidyltransferase domain-containing protein [bacterium]
MADFVATIPMNVIDKFCHRWKIAELALFGSALRDDFNPDSDLDFLVTFAPDAEWGLFDHVKMQQELQDLVSRRIDLVSRRALERSENWLRRQEILKTARVLFPKREAVYASG